MCPPRCTHRATPPQPQFWRMHRSSRCCYIRCNHSRGGKEENSMKAIVRDAYGPPEVLELRDIDIPDIASDVAGVVEAVGKNVSRFQPRDEVFGIGKGTYAEYVCDREEKLAHK